MKLADAQHAYRDLSGKASDVARTLAVSGIAIIWVFSTRENSGPSVPQELMLPGTLLIGSLAFDLLQYVLGTICWGLFARSKEKRGLTQQDSVNAPRELNWPQNTAFWLKILLLAIAYGLLLRYLMCLLFSGAGATAGAV